MKALLLLFVFFTQPTDELVRYCHANIHQERVTSDRADWLTQQLMTAYRNGGEDELDAVLDNSDSTWYSGMDLYLADNVAAVINAMNNDLQATYRDTSIKRATVKVAYDGTTYMVIVFSYR